MHISTLCSVSPPVDLYNFSTSVIPPPPLASLDEHTVTSVVYVDKSVDQCTDGDATDYVQTASLLPLCLLSDIQQSDDKTQIRTSKNNHV